MTTFATSSDITTNKQRSHIATMLDPSICKPKGFGMVLSHGIESGKEAPNVVPIVPALS